MHRTWHNLSKSYINIYHPFMIDTPTQKTNSRKDGYYFLLNWGGHVSVFCLIQEWVEKKKLPPWKLNCPQNLDHFNRKYIFQPLIFRGCSLVLWGCTVYGWMIFLSLPLTRIASLQRLGSDTTCEKRLVSDKFFGHATALKGSRWLRQAWRVAMSRKARF